MTNKTDTSGLVAAILLKLVIVPAGLIWLVSHLLSSRELGTMLDDPVSLILAFLVNQTAVVLFAIRMRLVLSAFGVKLSFIESLRIHLQSMFYYFALPMTVGLEMARFLKIRAIPANRDVPVLTLTTALFTDRLVGAFIAFMLSLVLWPFIEFDRLSSHGISGSFWIAISLVLAVATSVFVYRNRQRLITAVALWQGRLLMLFRGLITGCLVHLLFCLAIYIAARGIGIPVPAEQLAFIISAAMIFIVIPVSFAGAGGIEVGGMAIAFSLGLTIEESAAITLLGYLARIIVSIEGGIWEVWEGGMMTLSRLVDRE